MRRLSVIILGLLVCATATMALQQQPQPQAGDVRPNIVLIMSDDLGYADLSSYGATDIRTPNIDQIGRDGIRLTDFYANGVLCSPTRAGLISGRYQQRYVIESAFGSPARRGLLVTGNSLPQLLKDSGYATGLIGKWHIGDTPETSPNAHGFEYFWGFLAGYIDFYAHDRGPNQPDLWENDTAIEAEGYITDLITERSVSFIEQSAASGRPFFIDVAYNAPHWPYQPPGLPNDSVGPPNARHVMPHDPADSSRADYVAMVERVDEGVGRILETLERLGVSENTIVIFTNDNGGEWLSNGGPLFNRKWTVWEGGIRVPAVIRWPGRIPAGRVSEQVGITMDLSATILAAAGVPVPESYEGIDLMPILSGQAPEVERTLYWRTEAGNRSMRAVRSGDWKLVVDGNHVFVHNLRIDPGERNDLAGERRDIARRLRPMLAEWEREVTAEGAINDPEASEQVMGGGRGRGAAPAGRGGTQ